MKISMPNPGDGFTKCMNLVNFLCFLAIFIALLCLIWYICSWLWLRMVLLLVDYVLTSLIVYLGVRPCTLRVFDAMRRRFRARKR